MQHVIQNFELDCFIEAELSFTIESLRQEECHGYHYFDDSSCEVEKFKVQIDVGGMLIDITDRLTPEELKVIEKQIEPDFDIE
jgi:hypothetical protein